MKAFIKLLEDENEDKLSIDQFRETIEKMSISYDKVISTF